MIKKLVVALCCAATPAMAEVPSSMLCGDIVNKGIGELWSADASDYALSKPNSDKLGYGSACNINNLIFAQCFLEPSLSVKQAVDLLIKKAKAGKRLPDTPACGA